MHSLPSSSYQLYTPSTRFPRRLRSDIGTCLMKRKRCFDQRYRPRLACSRDGIVRVMFRSVEQPRDTRRVERYPEGTARNREMLFLATTRLIPLDGSELHVMMNRARKRGTPN